MNKFRVNMVVGFITLLVLFCITIPSFGPPVAAATSWPGPGGSTIDINFPGGNIIVDSYSGNTVYIIVDQRDSFDDWFYWHFRVQNAGGQSLTFSFARDTGGLKSSYIGYRGPAVSTDGGVTWSWMTSVPASSTNFTYAFPAGANNVRFAMCIPYYKQNWDSFISQYSGNPNVAGPYTLCTTFKNGLTDQYWRIGKVSGEPVYRVAMTARHHCCEATGDYALEGIIDGVLAATADGTWFRNNVEFLVVPFIDLAGVEAGDQGKWRSPHDHNRDYLEGIYPEVSSYKSKLLSWSNGKLVFALDLHAPGNVAAGHDRIYTYRMYDGSEVEFERYCNIVKNSATGALTYDPADNMTWEGAPSSCSIWTKNNVPGIRSSGTFEFPYARARLNATVTPDALRTFGRDMSHALKLWFDGLTSPTPTPTPGPTVTPGGPLFSDNFEDGSASDWSAGTGWSVITDGTYRYRGSGITGETISTNGNSAWTNYSFEAKIKATNLPGDGAPGILSRYVDANNFYRFYYSQSAGAWKFIKRLNGSWSTSLTGPVFTLNLNQDYLVKVEVNGSTLKLSVNGVLQIETTDTSFVSGKIGLYIWHAEANYDDIVVSQPGTNSPAPTPTATATLTPTPTATPTPGGSLFSDNFEDGNATGWTNVNGTWSVVTDGTYVYKNTNTTGESLTYAGQSTWTNYTVEAKVKLYNSGSTVGAGIVARYTDSNNYYMFRIHEGSDKAQLYKKAGGSFTLLSEGAVTVTANTIYTLKLVLSGSSLTGYVDGVQKVLFTDSSLTGGKIGARGYDVSFGVDDVVVY